MFNTKAINKIKRELATNDSFFLELLQQFGMDARRDVNNNVKVFDRAPNIVAMQKGFSTIGTKVEKIKDGQQKLMDQYSLSIQYSKDVAKQLKALEAFLGIEYKTLVSKTTVEEVKGYDKVSKKVTKKVTTKKSK